MGPTTIAVQRRRPWAVICLGILMALMAFLFLPPSSASAETTDDGQEVTDFYFAGVVTNADEPVEGVVMSIEGNGFEAETETDADGKWRLYVPEMETYTLTVDESTPVSYTHLTLPTTPYV